MSLRQGFAKVAKKIGVAPPLSLAPDLQAAIAADDGAAVTALLALDPELAKGKPAADAFLEAVATQKPAAAKAMADAAPQLLTDTDANGANAAMRMARSPVSAEAFRILLSLYTPALASITDNKNNTLLHYAARSEGIDTVTPVLALVPALVNAVNNKGETPLMDAVRGEGDMAAKKLLAAGGRLDIKNVAGVSITMNAIRHSNLQAAVTFIEAGGVVDFNDPAVDIQLRVASSELNLTFLDAIAKARDGRNTQQQQKHLDLKTSQLAETAKVLTGMSQGLGDDVTAPTRAAFGKRRKPGSDI